MNLDQFRYIKSEIIRITSRYEELQNSGLKSDQIKEEIEQLVKKFNSLQEQLLNSDLSKIPFEEWEGLTLLSAPNLDFSKTHANIDFSLIKEIPYDEDTFDLEFIKNNPQYFLDATVPEVIKRKFYNGRLSFEDLINYPSLVPCVTKYSFGYPSSSLIDAIGIESALKLFSENPEFIKYITSEVADEDYHTVYFIEGKIEDDKTYEEKKQFIYELVVEKMKKHSVFLPKEIIPTDLASMFPSVFIKKGELPDDIIDDYYRGDLTLSNVRKYEDILKTKDVNIVARNIHYLKKFEILFGDVWDFIKQVPDELEKIILYYLAPLSEEDLKKLKTISKEELFTNAIKEYHSRAELPIDLNTRIACSEYLPIEEVIPNRTIRDFILKCGFTLLREYNVKNNNILDISYYNSNMESLLVGALAEYSKKVSHKEPINNLEELHIYLEKIIRKMRKDGRMLQNNMFRKNNKEMLSKVFKNDFLDYELLEKILNEIPENKRAGVFSELEFGFHGAIDRLLKIMNQYPKLVTLLENKEFVINDEYNSLYKSLYDSLGKEKFLKIGSLYGIAINELIQSPRFIDLIYDLKYYDNFEDLFNDAIYRRIIEGKFFDIRNLPDSFKKLHPELYLPSSAPQELQSLFYKGEIDPKVINTYPEWIKYLTHIDLKNCLRNITIYAVFENGVECLNIYEALAMKFNQEEILSFLSKYGEIVLKDIQFTVDLRLTKEQCYENMLKRIYKSIEIRQSQHKKEMPEEFKLKYKDMFLSDDAPISLQMLFYERKIGPTDIQQNPEWIEYLLDKNLKVVCEQEILDFIYDAYRINLSNKEILEIFNKYGEYLKVYKIRLMYVGDIDSFIKLKIVQEITRTSAAYDEDLKKLIGDVCPDIFLDDMAPVDLRKRFYQRNISAELIQQNPEWIKYLLNKDLRVCFESNILAFIVDAYSNVGLGNERILELFNRYGKYLTKCDIRLNILLPNLEKDQIYEYIDKSIINSITNDLTVYGEDLKDLIGNIRPDLFLDENAPFELRYHFYGVDGKHGIQPLTFKLLKQHKEWLPYLKDKNVLLSLQKGVYYLDHREGLKQMFERYGPLEALNIGIKNPESVMKMIESNKFELFSKWYDKLNFIPHHVVMLDFPFSQSDKFISSGKKWSQLMKIERHNLNEEGKSALLKASMCFGVFDNDNVGFNKILNLFTGIPRTLSEGQMSGLLWRLESRINPGDILGLDNLYILQKCYAKNNDGIFTLKINPEQNKLEANVIRELMESVGFYKVISLEQSHKLFGGFEMKYAPDFRDFLLENIEKILSSDNISYISSIQKQWDEIKSFNSNRKLTLDLALACVISNKYQNVEVGNQKLAEVSNQAGYGEDTFNTLQQIYNYGKQRVFSSIPRVSGTKGEYTYEILRLDDPLAVAIGTLSDCCQELGNAAETCMEHSMVDKHGRIFVIKNKLGEIVAQSWVWRNNNTICFDNIEVPDKQMHTHGIKRGMEDSGIRNKFTDEILSIYKLAAEEMVDIDKKTYSKLLEEGKITEEQYESFILRKVTTGVGYSNIKGSFETLEEDDKLIRPLNFKPPVELTRSLYTNDSNDTQYILSGKRGIKTTSSDTLTLYPDEFVIYDKTNIKPIDLLLLKKLEYATNQYSDINYEESLESEDIISDIAYNYDLNYETTKIIMNANFAIIYDDLGDSIVIGGILYNRSVNIKGEQIDIKNKVLMQIRNAIEQLKLSNKKIDVSSLGEEELQMFNKAMDLKEEIDIERGITPKARSY